MVASVDFNHETHAVDMSHHDSQMSTVLESALIELLSEFEYGDVTVSSLTREAGVNRTSFYRRFDSVDEVVTEIYGGNGFDREIRSRRRGMGVRVSVYYEGLRRVPHASRDASRATFSRAHPEASPCHAGAFPGGPIGCGFALPQGVPSRRDNGVADALAR